MRDITAILVHYSDRTVLHKALISLRKLGPRLKSVIVFQEQTISHMGHGNEWIDRIQYIVTDDLGEMLNSTIANLTSFYVLFLQDTEYLSSTITIDCLKLLPKKTVLGTYYHNRDIVTHHPFLVRTSFLKKETFMSNLQLPFKEALLPVWLSKVETSLTYLKKDLIKRARENSSANTIEKQRFIQKYQLAENRMGHHPTISVLISNYNMERYVETAVASCLLQSQQPEQVLIIDDGSTDNSYKQLSRWDNGKQVKVFNKNNEGKAKALNAILPHVKSDFILELDADDWLDPDAVSVIKRKLADLPKDTSVLYGNLRRWKQLKGDVLYKVTSKGSAINGADDLMTYRFPLGPRIYRTAYLKKSGGFPVVAFENGRLYEDVSVLRRLIKTSWFCYRDFTVYNVREHKESITKSNPSKWGEFLKMLNPTKEDNNE